jgi:protease I
MLKYFLSGCDLASATTCTGTGTTGDNSLNGPTFGAPLPLVAANTPACFRPHPLPSPFATRFSDAGKPVASICHGPWMVIEAGGARGRRVTSWPSLRTDLKNAGADWVDEEVVVDRGLVTSRKPDDIPAYNREMIKLFTQARSRSRRAA